MTDELIISIKRKKKKRAPRAVDLPHGILAARRADDYLPRRLQKGGIRFYDLGYFFDAGIKRTLGENFFPVVSASPDNTYLVYNQPTDAENATLFNGILNEFLGLSPAELKRIFYQIKKGDVVFEKAITVIFERTPGNVITDTLDNLPEFKAQGLILTAAQLATIRFQPCEFLFNTADFNLASIKATLTNDYNAAAAAFDFSGSIDFFLCPVVLFLAGDALYKNGLHSIPNVQSDYVQYDDAFSPQYRILPRDLLQQIYNAFALNSSTYPFRYAIWQIFKQLPNEIAYRIKRDFSNSPPYSYFTTMSQVALSNFPYPPVYTNTNTPSVVNTGGGADDAYNIGTSAGIAIYNNASFSRLKAIAVKNNQLFYIWQSS